jgi:hypothetical protein
MTNFVDIYQDLPCRVTKVWQRLQQQEKQQGECDLSVTAMLMTAATGLAMPWESLKDVGMGNSKNWNDPPSFVNGDQRHYKEVLKRCDAFLAKKISQIDSLKSISFLHCPSMEGIRDAVEYGNKDETVLSLDQHQVRCLIRILRNALAHNNIVAFGDNVNEIKKLGFFSEKKTKTGNNCTTKDGYLVLVIDTTAFQTFLKAWFDVIAPQTDSANDEQP